MTAAKREGGMKGRDGRLPAFEFLERNQSSESAVFAILPLPHPRPGKRFPPSLK